MNVLVDDLPADNHPASILHSSASFVFSPIPPSASGEDSRHSVVAMCENPVLRILRGVTKNG